MLTVYGRRSSFNVQKVMWLVGELGLDHVHVDKGGEAGGLDTPDFRAMNPHGKVPVIDDGGTVVWESHAILRYLAARHGVPQFWPDDPGDRSRADRWMDWGQATLQRDFLTGVFWGGYRTPPAQRDNAAVAAAIARCADHMRLLDRFIGDRPFLLGSRLSLADIVLGTHFYRYYGIDIDRPAVPGVEGWYRRLTDRPAYREAVMIPFDHLRGRLAF